MKNRSRNNSIDSTSNKSRNNSIEFNVKSSSEKSTRSYSIGSIESFSLEDDDWAQNMDNENNSKYNDDSINRLSPHFLYSNKKNKKNVFIQNDKKCRKRDAYIHNINESPKPSKFMEYMKQILKK